MAKSWHTLWRRFKGSSDDLGEYGDPSHFFLPEGKHIDDVVGIAIDGNDPKEGAKTYTWFADLTFCVGNTTRLDEYQSLRTYRLPRGKSPEDIVDMAIDGTPVENNVRVFTWFKDGTVCAGGPRKLDKYREPYRYHLPNGKTPHNVVGIGIDGTPSNERGGMAFYWFDDGTVCAGSSSRADIDRPLYHYGLPDGCSPSRIIGMAISGRDENSGRVFTWMKQDIVASGSGWSNIESQVDDLIRDKMEDNYVPALSIAVSKEGRLVYCKSYGFSNLESNTLLKPTDRMRLGSVSKIITTLGVLKRMEQETNERPENQRFTLQSKNYGSNGLLDTVRYRDALEHAAADDKVGMAIAGSDGDTYVWRTDSTVTFGKTWDTDKLGSPRPFSLPPGKTPSDILDVSIDNSDRVHAWYVDRTRSIGTSTHLDQYEYITGTHAFTLPSGYRLDDGDGEREGAAQEVYIIGIAIAKSNNHLYAWYSNNMVSSGTYEDFDRHSPPRPYTLPPGKTPQDIVGIAIARNDHVYVSYRDGTMSSGTSTDLDQYREPYDTRSDATLEWYNSIQLQHLLSHTSGLWRNGKVTEAAAYFGIDEDELTYEDLHIYHLLTSWLKFKPGTAYSYSNHGMGLVGHITSVRAGQPYKAFIREHIIDPLELGIRAKPDAWGYSITRDKDDNPTSIESHAPERSTLGAAAGGWSTTPADFVRLLIATDPDLDGNETILTPDTLNQMSIKPFPNIAESHALGWKVSSSGRLDHSGATGAGERAYAVRYPKGFVRSDGVDMSHINVTICATGSVATSTLGNLARQVAIMVGRENIDPGYNLFPSRANP